jgi:hypothetical protein
MSAVSCRAASRRRAAASGRQAAGRSGLAMPVLRTASPWAWQPRDVGPLACYVLLCAFVLSHLLFLPTVAQQLCSSGILAYRCWLAPHRPLFHVFRLCRSQARFGKTRAGDGDLPRKRRFACQDGLFDAKLVLQPAFVASCVRYFYFLAQPRLN